MEPITQTSQLPPALVAFGQTAILILLRVLPVVTLTPLFGGPAVPRRLRTGLSVMLTITVLMIVSAPPAPVFSTGYFLALMAKELAIGIVFAVLVILVFEMASAAGGLVDLARGATTSSMLDPLNGVQSSILSVFFQQVAVVLFLSLGGYRLLIGALGDSFIAAAPHELLPYALLQQVTLDRVVTLAAGMFLLAFKLAAPAIVLSLAVDAGLALINRVSPQIVVFFIGMEAKPVLGLLVGMLGLGVSLAAMPGAFAQFLAGIGMWLGHGG